MAEELEGGVVEAPAADDLRAALETAWTDAETPKEAEPPEATAKDQPADAPAYGRARDEHGRFIKAEQPTDAKPLEAKPDLAAPELKDAVHPAQTQTAGPPPGWSVAAKAEFDKLPQSVREAVFKREEEVNRGLQKLADFKGLDPYVDMARQSGTTLDQALERYIAAENALANDFVSGIVGLCQMYNVHPAQLGQVLAGGQPQGGHQPPAGQMPQEVFAPMFNKLGTIEQRLEAFERQREAEEAEAINAQLHDFAVQPENQFYENVRHDMAALLQAGKATSLKDAYDQACWLNPEIRALRIKEQAEAQLAERSRTANQTRRASGSLSPGSPLPDAQQRLAGKSNISLRSQLEEAWDQAGAAI